jgi:hypothetical protein
MVGLWVCEVTFESVDELGEESLDVLARLG